MIGIIKGTIQHSAPPYDLVMWCGNIAYEIISPSDVLSRKPSTDITLYTHLQWREEGPCLYGFLEREQRNVFRILLKISGIGGKTAIAILSMFNGEQLTYIVQNEQITQLTQVSGIGKKTAERIMLELKNTVPFNTNIPSLTQPKPSNNAYSMAQAGLLNLGFKPHEVQKMLEPIDCSDQTPQDIIQKALKNA